MTILEKIELHNQAVLEGKIADDLTICPYCHQSPCCFKPHDVRSRFFRVIEENVVRKVQSYLDRWKCMLCKSIFTYYPDFAIPYKRYVKDDIVHFSRLYVDDEKISYEKTVQHKGFPIGYYSEKAKDDSYLYGSTVHRWLSWTGSLKEPLRHALNLVRQKKPSCHILRQIRPIAIHKYKSKERKSILDTCLRFFTAENEYKALFNRTIFTGLATPYLRI